MENEKITQTSINDDEEQGLALGEIVTVVMEYRWLIAATTLIAILLSAAYLFISQSNYRADGLIQVEEKGAGAGISSALKDLQPLLSDSTTVAAEQEILVSRLVLGRVIDRLKLDLDVKPLTFPVIGAAISRRYDGNGPRPSLLGMTGYAWGGEILQVDALDVPSVVEDKPLMLVAKEEGKFELLNAEGSLILRGSAGVRERNGPFSIFVARIVANPETRFVLVKRSMESAVGEIRKKLAVKERGKKSGILEVTLTGRDPEKLGIVLDNILNTYVRQNVERRSAEAENTLKFLETQLPGLKREMDAAEVAYNSYRQSRGSLDLSIETQSVLQSVVEVDNQIVALRQERDELRQNFTAEHPRVQAVDSRLERLKERRKEFDVEVSKLPDTQQKVLRLARDVEVSTTLYTNLVNTAQQLKVSKAGTVGDVRIIDSPIVGKNPIGLPPPAIVSIALIIGLLLSALIIWILRSMRVVVENPDVIEGKLGLPVYATIPYSESEIFISKDAEKKGSAPSLLAIAKPEDDAIESIRGLRATIHFALLDAQKSSLLITGSSPGLGKSFVSKNLGVVLAQAGKKVIVIDADLRRGHIHKEFGLKRDHGLSEYIGGRFDMRSIIKTTSVPNLSVITTGQIPPNPSELLMHERLGALFSALEAEFDTLIVDAPPVLAVSDAVVIGRHVGATMLVARAGQHPIAELEQAIKRLRQGGVEVKGFIFNGMDMRRQRYRYGYSGYQYKYSYSQKK